MTTRTTGRLPGGLRRPWWAWLCAGVSLPLVVWPWPPYSPDPDLVGAAALWAVTVVVLVVAGWTLVPRAEQRRNAALMLVLAVLFATYNLDNIDPGPWHFLVWLQGPLGPVILAILLLRWPQQRMHTRKEVRFGGYAVGSVLALGLFQSVTWDPIWNGYHGAGWWPTLVSNRALNDPVTWIFRGNEAVLVVLFLLLLGARLRRVGRTGRRPLAPVVVAASALGVVCAGFIVDGFSGVFPSAPFTVLEYVAFLAVPVSFLVSAAVRRVQRALAVETLLRPARLPDAESVRATLARALGDRGLTLALWSPELGAFVVAGSGPADDGTAVARWPVEVADADGAPLARLGLDRRLAASRDLVDSVVQAASLALGEARLQAELLVRRREVEDSAAELSSLSRLVPGGLKERLRNDPAVMSRTEHLVVTVLMSDIRGYSAIAEATPPGDLAPLLNEHRRAMNGVILGEGGTVLQYVGDAVLAVFGAPGELPGHAEHALRAAAGMHRAQELLNEDWRAAGLPSFGLGVGVSTGPVAAAFLGSDERVEYTVVGDTVNLAARLTDEARPAGTTVAAAATVREAGGSWQVEPLPLFRVKGRTTPVSAYRMTGSVVREAREAREADAVTGSSEPAGIVGDAFPQ